MRTTIRLVAPLSILVTALYLAFLSYSHAGFKSDPITTVDNQSTNIISPSPQTGGRLAIGQVRSSNSKDGSGTSTQIHP